MVDRLLESYARHAEAVGDDSLRNKSKCVYGEASMFCAAMAVIFLLCSRLPGNLGRAGFAIDYAHRQAFLRARSFSPVLGESPGVPFGFHGKCGVWLMLVIAQWHAGGQLGPVHADPAR
jgi:hypothetical protein